MECGDPRMLYTSPSIQNELISIAGEQISSDLVAACNKAGMFGFIADEATDASTMEQMALCVRFVDDNLVREEFLGFSETSSTTGEALSTAFLHRLEQLGNKVKHIYLELYSHIKYLDEKDLINSLYYFHQNYKVRILSLGSD
jgi:hypothetical protein